MICNSIISTELIILEANRIGNRGGTVTTHEEAEEAGSAAVVKYRVPGARATTIRPGEQESEDHDEAQLGADELGIPVARLDLLG